MVEQTDFTCFFSPSSAIAKKPSSSIQNRSLKRRLRSAASWARRSARCDVQRAERLAQEAADLKRRFSERFWMEDEGFFAMALDGEKKQVKSVCSTIGHALW